LKLGQGDQTRYESVDFKLENPLLKRFRQKAKKKKKKKKKEEEKERDGNKMVSIVLSL